MRIAVLADTHNRLPDFVPGLLGGADEIWHLGDVCDPPTLAPLHALGKTMRIVHGNCDEPHLWPAVLHFTLEGFRIFLVHIPPDIPPPGIDLLFHGHTHVPRNEVVRGCRYLNPGCITRPNRGAPASFAWLTLERGGQPGWELARLR